MPRWDSNRKPCDPQSNDVSTRLSQLYISLTLFSLYPCPLLTSPRLSSHTHFLSPLSPPLSHFCYVFLLFLSLQFKTNIDHVEKYVYLKNILSFFVHTYYLYKKINSRLHLFLLCSESIFNINLQI